MNFSFHNQLNVYISDKKYTFFNSLLPSFLNQLSNFDKYNQYLAVGNGQTSTNVDNNYKLSNYICTLNLQNSAFQSDISKGSLYSKYEFYAKHSQIPSDYISEIGLCNNESDPTIFNYFSLISSDHPLGLDISNVDELVFEVFIFLNVDEQNEIIFTAGNNPFFEFLLGNGLEQVYLATGSNAADNIRLHRRIKNKNSLLPVEMNCFINENSIEINLSTTIQSVEEIDEILFISNSRVFARKNLKEIKPTIQTEKTKTSWFPKVRLFLNRQ